MINLYVTVAKIQQFKDAYAQLNGSRLAAKKLMLQISEFSLSAILIHIFYFKEVVETDYLSKKIWK